MAYAVLNDVAVRLGRPIIKADEIAQVTAWLTDIESVIVARFARNGLVLSTQIALNNPSLETVVRVEASAIVRKLSNPTGLTSVTRSVDDSSVTERREGGGPIGGLDLLDGEWNDLLPSVTSGAFSTYPGFVSDADVTDWTIR